MNINNKRKSRFSKSVEGSSDIPFHKVFDSDDYMAPIQIPVSNPANIDKNDVKKRSLGELMDCSRDAALKVPISSTNKGFKLLMKIGYKEGEGLGKDGMGIIEPIAVTKRNNKDVSGLGIEEMKNEELKKREDKKIRNNAVVEKIKQYFTDNRSQTYNNKKRKKDIIKIRNSIYELDVKKNISYHELWPSKYITDGLPQEDIDE